MVIENFEEYNFQYHLFRAFKENQKSISLRDLAGSRRIKRALGYYLGTYTGNNVFILRMRERANRLPLTNPQYRAIYEIMMQEYSLKAQNSQVRSARHQFTYQGIDYDLLVISEVFGDKSSNEFFKVMMNRPNSTQPLLIGYYIPEILYEPIHFPKAPHHSVIKDYLMAKLGITSYVEDLE